MGLDVSHGAWRGAYSAFMGWREKIAELAGFPPLMLMEGFYDNNRFLFSENDFGIAKQVKEYLPISWGCLKTDPLIELLHHSDCDGEIEWYKCGVIADRLEEILELMPDEDTGGHIGNWKDKTQTFIDGLIKAYVSKEDLHFG